MYEEQFRDNTALASHIYKLIRACEQHSEEQKKSRDRALEYYDGEMNDAPPEEGRSAVVSKDVRGVVKKLMPSIMRTLVANDKMVEYDPVGDDDEDHSTKATLFINHVIVPESGVEDAISDAIFDAIMLKTGILKWSAYEKREVKFYDYTDQPDDALLGLEGEPGVEILDLESVPETDEEILAVEPDAQRHSFRLKRIEARRQVMMEALPRGAFLIAPKSNEIESAPIVGERQYPTRSDLVSRGYNRDIVWDLSEHELEVDDYEDTEERKGEDYTEIELDTRKAMETILVYEVYVRLDMDDDGIAELYKVVMAEGGSDQSDESSYVILEAEAVSEAPYADVKIEREAHQFEGHSVAEDIIPLQLAKTALLRQTLDNVYWANNPQPGVQPDALTTEGLEAVFTPEFGKPITLKPNKSLAEAIQWNQIPFMADKSFAMLDYLDEEGRDRTGFTDESGGVDPEQFQNMAATNAALLSDAGVAQAEMALRSLARGGIKKAFRGLLKLVIAHTDQPRTKRLKGELHTFDPRHWDVDMDCTVNIGLGAGSRTRDLQVLQIILGLQREIVSSIGADNPLVTPEQLYNTLAKITETAGFPSADPYFTKPDPNHVAALMAKGNGPSEAEMKLQAQGQLEQVKAQARAQVEQAQMQADLMVKEAELQKDAQIEILKAESAKEIALLRGELDLLKHQDKMRLEYDKLNLQQPVVPGAFEAGSLIHGA